MSVRFDFPLVGVGLIGDAPVVTSRLWSYATLARLHVRPPVLPIVQLLAGDLEPEAASSPELSGIPVTQEKVNELFSDGRDYVAGIIDVCSDLSTRSLSAIAAAQAGRHLLCEAPIAADADGAHAVWRAAVEAEVTHACMLPLRFSPAAWRAREMLETGAIGDLVSVDIGVDRESQLVHGIDLIRFITGREITSVRVLDPSGQAAVLQLSDGSGTLRRIADFASVRLTLEGSRGQIVLDDTAPGALLVDDERIVVTTDPEYGDPIRRIDEQTLIAVTAGWLIRAALFNALDSVGAVQIGPRGATLMDGYRASEVLDALGRSRETGQEEVVRYLE